MDIIKSKDFNKIYECVAFSGELQKLFKKHPHAYKEYAAFLFAALKMLDTAEDPPIYGKFEKLKCKTPLYSLRYKREKNVRVLYFWCEEGQVILLTAFEEKEKSDYTEAIRRSEKRLKSLGLI